MIKEGFKIRELGRTFIFLLIQGGVYPNYEDYMYFYLTDPGHAGFSRLTYGLLRMVSFAGMFIGAAAFALYLKKLSFRTMMIISSFIYILAAIG